MVIKITVDIDKEMFNNISTENKDVSKEIKVLSDVKNEDNNENNSNDNNDRLDKIENSVDKLSKIVEKLSDLISDVSLSESKIESIIDKKLSSFNNSDNSTADLDIDKIVEEKMKKKEELMMSQFQNQVNLMNQNHQMTMMNMLNQLQNPAMNQNVNHLNSSETLEKENVVKKEIEEKEKAEAPKKDVRNKLSSMMDI